MKMKAVILAAGKGTRMMPLTKDIPKPLVQVGGKPFLTYLIDHIHKAGITDIGIVCNYKKEKIEEYAQQYKVQLTLIEQEQPLGTGDAVNSVKSFVGDQDFIVLSADNLVSPSDIMAVANAQGCCIAALHLDNAQNYGLLDVQNGLLKGILEKPKDPVPGLINAGMYKLTSQIFNELAQIPKSPRGEYEVTDAMTNLALHQDFAVHVLQDYWLDITKPEDIPVVEKALTSL